MATEHSVSETIAAALFLPLQQFAAMPALRLRVTYTLSLFLGLQEIMMSHSAQVILAISISGALCLTAWGWARHRLGRLSHPERE
jgi:hypothetical protein